MNSILTLVCCMLCMFVMRFMFKVCCEFVLFIQYYCLYMRMCVCVSIFMQSYCMF